ncbi:type VI secretion system-associated FHA domain protein TagH [Phenylobacterium sp.]|uniref:type VI secretion system-associated FHA domain protein TagH n=1 Tax=Phenylobacterium sp. TaxID=1871053 RepID=UPI0035B42590
MVTLRLFHQSDPFRQIEARAFDGGELTIGRDAAADWIIPDPDKSVSRLHCVLADKQGRLSLRDTSSNGVFVGNERRRLQPLEPAPVELGETFRLGGYLIVIDPGNDERAGFDAPFCEPMLKPMSVTSDALSVPTDWADADAPEAAARPPADGSLLEAFCEGAKLDASAFSGEEPAQVMRRLGAVYQQMVLGLGDLMSERTTLKTEYRMTRTTVRAEGNNPFKWAPAHRVAVDLLHARDDGFLSGPAAVKSSFEDLKKHLLCILAGLRAALGATLESLDPDLIEESLKGRAFVLQGRAAAAWGEYLKLYDEVRQQADNDPDSPVSRAFRAAYEQQLKALDAMGPAA